MRREKSLRNGIHHANAGVWGPVYGTHHARHPTGERMYERLVAHAALCPVLAFNSHTAAVSNPTTRRFALIGWNRTAWTAAPHGIARAHRQPPDASSSSAAAKDEEDDCVLATKCARMANFVYKGGGVESWMADDGCLLYTSPSPRDGLLSRMPSSA